MFFAILLIVVLYIFVRELGADQQHQVVEFKRRDGDPNEY